MQFAPIGVRRSGSPELVPTGTPTFVPNLAATLRVERFSSADCSSTRFGTEVGG